MNLVVVHNLEAHCKTIEENNIPITEFLNGNAIIINGKHSVNNKTYEGSNLIQFNNTTKTNDNIPLILILRRSMNLSVYGITLRARGNDKNLSRMSVTSNVM